MMVIRNENMSIKECLVQNLTCSNGVQSMNILIEF